MIVRVVCAWCGCHMGIKKFEGKNDTGPSISHGICPECIPGAIAEMEETVARYMENNHNNQSKENKNE